MRMGLKIIWTLLLADIHRNLVASITDKSDLIKYCRDKDRPIASEENDEYLLVNAEINTTIILECRFCNEDEEAQPKVWYHQDRHQTSPEQELELGMDNNASYNKFHVTSALSLTIKNFEEADTGIYRCHGEEGQEEENKFNYRLESVFKDDKDVFVASGNFTEWEKYREIYLAPVTTRFAVSRMPDLVDIREKGIVLMMVSEWGQWSSCGGCVRKKGYKTSRGYCRLKRVMNTTSDSGRKSAVYNFFRNSPMLPCKSMLLHEEFPSISSATRYLPEFELKEPCKKCPALPKTRPKQRFRYKRRYVLAEGAHLAVMCPETSPEVDVTWKKDSITLKKGFGRSLRKKDPESRVIVDTFSTLYLLDVSEHEGGNYTCYVNNINMMSLKVIVVSKSKLLTEAFLRHLGYLGFIFLLTSFCYCAGLVLTCRQRHKFKVKYNGASATGEENSLLAK